MVLLLLGAMGCQQDVVRVMGAVTGIKVSPRPPSVAADAGPEHTPVTASVSVASAPAPQPADVAAEAATVSEPPAGDKFNPISVPQGPRDSPGVRWDGVRGHTQEAIAEERSQRKLDR